MICHTPATPTSLHQKTILMTPAPILSPLRHALAALLLILSACLATAAPADIRVLIVKGFSNHSVEKTTQKIRDILATEPAFKVSVSTMPAFDTEAWRAWEPNFAAYDVIIQTCNNYANREITWPDRVKAELESYLRGGGGMYVYHGATTPSPAGPNTTR